MAPQTQTFDPDAFHQSYVQQSGGDFDPDSFHAQYTSGTSGDEDITNPDAMLAKASKQASAAGAAPLSADALAAGGYGEASTPAVRSQFMAPKNMFGPRGETDNLTPDQQRARSVATQGGLIQSAKDAPVALGGALAPELLGPEAGLLMKGAMSAGGAGIGSVAGQAATGENPLSKENMDQTAENAAGAGVGTVGFGAASDVLGKALAPTAGKAEALSNRALFPRDMPVGDQPDIHQEFGRVFRNVGPYTKAAPLESGEGGAMRGAQQVRQAAQNIWDERVEPVLSSYGHVQRPTDDIAAKIRGTVSSTDQALDSPRAAATEKLAGLYDGKVQTVRDMANRVTELNNDKAVSRFQNMDANGQSQALLADPALRGKVAELNGLRDKLFDTVGEAGGETLGDEFRESRKDWGALRSYEDRVLNAKVPTPQPFYKRAANTARAVIGMKNDPLSVGASDTLGRLDNPNRLIPKALNMAGKAGAAGQPRPSVAGQGEAVPYTPANRMLPPIKPQAIPLGGETQQPSPLESESPRIEPTTRAERRGLLLGGEVQRRPSIVAGGEIQVEPQPRADTTTRAVQKGLLLPEAPAQRASIVPEKTGPLARIEGKDYQEPPQTFANRKPGSKSITEVDNRGKGGKKKPPSRSLAQGRS